MTSRRPRPAKLLLLLAAVALFPQAAYAGWERWGRMESLPGRGCVVLAAPHGTYDVHTDALTRELAGLTGFSAVIATGFVPPGPGNPSGRRINVNRPTEGAGLADGEEAETARAREVFAEYARRVGARLRGLAPALYVEIHGQSRFADAAEVAVGGLGREDAQALKRIWAEELRAAGPLCGRVELRVEGADPIFYRARSSKRIGVLGRGHAALHLELPRAMRTGADCRAAAARLLARVIPRFHAERLGACRSGN